MTYIAPVKPTETDAATAATLNAVKGKIGMIPNLFATLARSPVALNGLLQLNETIASGNLSPGEREIVALAVSQANTCHYCLSAHTLLGKGAGLSIEQTQQARAGNGSSPRARAIAAYAKTLVEQKGHVPTSVLDQFKAAGLSEGDLLEVIVNVVATTLTNYANNVARTEIDFPVVPVQLAA